jgi:hypothetical protein
MRKRPLVGIAVFCSILLGNTPVFSGEAAIGSTVTPEASQPLRARPPGGFFVGKGPEIGIVKPENKYIVLDQKLVPSITGTESWVEVKSVDSDEVGWSLYGRGSDSLTNFKMTK